MNKETRKHHIIVDVPKDIPSEFVHEIYENVIKEAVQVFYVKNHDYNSSWRIESVDSVTREILTRCYRTLKLLELESEGKEGKVAEGIESELKDVINWAIFGVLLRRGYGLDLDQALADPTGINLNDFSKAPPEPAFEPWAIPERGSVPDLLLDEEKPVQPVQQVKVIEGTPISSPRTTGTVGSDWDVFAEDIAEAEKVAMGDPNAGLTMEITREINSLYSILMQKSNPYPAVIFLPVENPINQIGQFAIGPNVYVQSQALSPAHSQLVVDGLLVDKVTYIRVKENGAFDGRYETDTEAQVLAQLGFLAEVKQSGEVDLAGQNAAAQLFLANQKL